MTDLTQSGEVNSTHDKGWKDSRVVIYRRRRSTRGEFDSTSDVGRRDAVTDCYIQNLNIPRMNKPYHIRIPPTKTVRYHSCTPSIFNTMARAVTAPRPMATHGACRSNSWQVAMATHGPWQPKGGMATRRLPCSMPWYATKKPNNMHPWRQRNEAELILLVTGSCVRLFAVTGTPTCTILLINIHGILRIYT